MLNGKFAVGLFPKHPRTQLTAHQGFPDARLNSHRLVLTHTTPDGVILLPALTGAHWRTDMAKVTVSGFVYHYQSKWDESPSLRFVHWDNWGDNDPDYALIGPASFEYELPENFSPVPAKLAALEKVKQKVRAEFAARVKELDDQINSLLALEMS